MASSSSLGAQQPWASSFATVALPAAIPSQGQSNQFGSMAPPATVPAHGQRTAPSLAVSAQDQSSPFGSMAQPAAVPARGQSSSFGTTAQPAAGSPAAVSRQNSLDAQKRHIAHQAQVASELQAHAREQQSIAEGHHAQAQKHAQEELAAKQEFERQNQIAASCKQDAARAQAQMQALSLQQQQIDADARARATVHRKQREFEREHRDMGYRSTAGPTDGLLLEAAAPGMTPQKRVRAQIMAVCALVFLPWALFALLFACATFWRHENPGIYVLALVLSLVAILVLGIVEFLLLKQRQSALLPKKRGPQISAGTILCVLLLVAVVAAYMFGNINYHLNMEPWHDMQGLKTYSSLDPSLTDGKQVMDAGVINFVDTAKLELQKSTGFKNNIMYCVAPIVNGNMSSYDFWAVGVDCCSNTPGSFKCGEWQNTKANAGLRLMDPDKRGIYQLALQAAAATLKIKAEYPLFFEWVEEPAEYMKTWKQDAQTYYVFGIFTFFGFNLLFALAFMISTWAVHK